MSTMNLTPVLRQRFFDHATGAPLVGGLLYSYIAGTSTPQNTYTDQSGNTPSANPIVLDSNGECTMWVDPTLSYKFILTDSLGNSQWTVDNVIGLLTSNAVNTAALQDGSVTSSKLAAGAVNSAALQSDATIDANRPVNTNNIRNGAITRSKLNSTQAMLAPGKQQFTATGSGTYNKTYKFLVVSATCALGDTYTNNGNTYTSTATISSATVFTGTGNADPQTIGTLTRATGSGDATIAFSAFVAPLYIRVKMVGAGGGGASGGNGNQNGAAGGSTTFGSTFLTANGGAGGLAGDVGVSGGTATIGSGATGTALTGGSSQSSSAGNSTLPTVGGSGGASVFGSGGWGGRGTGSVGASGSANTGSGGGGGGAPATYNAGSGGGAGGYIDAIIFSPSATYSLSVGTGGLGDTHGGANGGNGGSGIVILEEYFQ